MLNASLTAQYSAGVGWSMILLPIGQAQSSPTVIVTTSMQPSVVVHTNSYLPAAEKLETLVMASVATAIIAVPSAVPRLHAPSP